MFGTYIAATWAITHNKNRAMYFLSNSTEDFTLITWTRRKEKAMRFSTQDQANTFAKSIKEKRDQKSLQLAVTQV